MELLIALGLMNAYNMPSSIAIYRRMHDRTTLSTVNLLFGWTILGWFTCLLWAALGRAD